MKRGSIWTILGVIVAVVISWILVEALFRLMFWMAKLGTVVIVAVIVYVVLRLIFRDSRKDE